MFTRATGFVIVPVWMATMTWLVAHDVWPGLTADDPPLLEPTEWFEDQGRETQFTVLDPSGDRLGQVWTSYLIDTLSMRREDWIWLNKLPFSFGPLRLYVSSTYTARGVLDEFTVALESPEALLELHGERFHADFSFELEGYVGRRHVDTNFKIPLVEGGVLSSGFNTYAPMTGLHVGQTWRVQVFNPVSALVGMGRRFLPMVVRVTGKERVSTPDGVHECFVLESARTKAWVDVTGIVRVQEMDLPTIGRIRIVREPGFDEKGKESVLREPLYMGWEGAR